MCNCNNNNSLCSRCSKGLTCQCPPDYTVASLPVDCGCCPSGYTWSGATPNYPNGVCTGAGGKQIEPIPCTPCEEAVQADCVILPAISCLGLPAGMTLTSFVTYLCSDAFTFKLLQNIGLSNYLQDAFCEITSTCPLVGSTTPIPGPIVVV